MRCAVPVGLRQRLLGRRPDHPAAAAVLETVLNVTTPLRLLELADPAHPLLKKLLQLAPGTYNHSIMMGTLAEGAADAIGANPNLARVGAYYHDIGKTARPEYFVENQIYVGNPHDHLSPHLSKVAIQAHVRDGERMGRMYGLPKPVVDIIKQHHGTSLLAYFYNKAKESSKEAVPEESFRYEGEKPQSKEAAIIMLADGVEAAVRALERPTRRKIQGVIRRDHQAAGAGRTAGRIGTHPGRPASHKRRL